MRLSRASPQKKTPNRRERERTYEYQRQGNNTAPQEAMSPISAQRRQLDVHRGTPTPQELLPSMPHQWMAWRTTTPRMGKGSEKQRCAHARIPAFTSVSYLKCLKTKRAVKLRFMESSAFFMCAAFVSFTSFSSHRGFDLNRCTNG